MQFVPFIVYCKVRIPTSYANHDAVLKEWIRGKTSQPNSSIERRSSSTERLSRTEHKVHHAYSGERLEDPETLDDGVGAACKKHAAHAEWCGVCKPALLNVRSFFGVACRRPRHGAIEQKAHVRRQEFGFEFGCPRICISNQTEPSVNDLVGRGLPATATGFGAVMRDNLGYGFRAMKRHAQSKPFAGREFCEFKLLPEKYIGGSWRGRGQIAMFG